MVGGEHDTKMNETIYLFTNKSECCGCTACYAICPKNAISMVTDEEGFDYPIIDNNKCIKCHQCLMVCPFKKPKDHTDTY